MRALLTTLRGCFFKHAGHAKRPLMWHLRAGLVGPRYFLQDKLGVDRCHTTRETTIRYGVAATSQCAILLWRLLRSCMRLPQFLIQRAPIQRRLLAKVPAEVTDVATIPVFISCMVRFALLESSCRFLFTHTVSHLRSHTQARSRCSGFIEANIQTTLRTTNQLRTPLLLQIHRNTNMFAATRVFSRFLLPPRNTVTPTYRANCNVQLWLRTKVPTYQQPRGRPSQKSETTPS